VKKRILFVDDDELVLEGIETWLRSKSQGWEPMFALGGREAIGALHRDVFDVVVTDLDMPHVDGAEVLSVTRQLHPNARRVILTGSPEKAERLEVHAVVAKGLGYSELFALLARTLGQEP
jgi:DNA-binding NarL/FixJ family response regulator